MRSRRPALATAALLSVLVLAGCGADDGGETAADRGASKPTASPTTPDAPTSEGATGSCEYTPEGQEPARKVDLPSSKPTVSGEVPVLIATSFGDLRATLDADATPCTVNSFVSLAGQGYYDGTPCHRLTSRDASIFVLQCGDPTGTGYGGPGYTIADELTGDEAYAPGTIAMARTRAPNSGGSQFFLVYDDTPLPPDYAVFGRLDDASLEKLQQMADKGTDTGAPDGAPATPVLISRVTVEN